MSNVRSHEWGRSSVLQEREVTFTASASASVGDAPHYVRVLPASGFMLVFRHWVKTARRGLLAMSTIGEDRLGRRLRSSKTKALYDLWLDARRGLQRPDGLPLFEWFEHLQGDGDDNLVFAVIDRDAPYGFRMLKVGQAIQERFATMDEQAGPFPGDEELGSLEAAYRRVTETASPSYDYARFSVGGAPALLFERLLLPLSSDGKTVSHLLAMVVFSDIDNSR